MQCAWRRVCNADLRGKTAKSRWHLAELLADAAQIEGGKAHLLRVGWCYHHLEPPNNDETIKAWSEASSWRHGRRPQDCTSAICALGKHAAQAVADWQKALEFVKTPEDFRTACRTGDVYKLFGTLLTVSRKPTPSVVAEHRKAPSVRRDQRLAKAAGLKRPVARKSSRAWPPASS